MMLLMVLGAVLIFLGILVGIVLLIFTMPIVFASIKNNELLKHLFLKIKNFDNRDFPFSLIKLENNFLTNVLVHVLVALAIVTMLILGTMVALQLWYRKKYKYLNRFSYLSFIFSILLIVLLAGVLLLTGMWWLFFTLITISIGTYFLQHFFISYIKKMSLANPSNSDDKIVYDQLVKQKTFNNETLSSKNISIHRPSASSLQKIMQSSENFALNNSLDRNEDIYIREKGKNNESVENVVIKEKVPELINDFPEIQLVSKPKDTTKQKQEQIKFENNAESKQEFILKTFLPKNNIQNDAINDKHMVKELKTQSIIQKERKEEMVVDASKVYYHSQSSGKTIEISRELTQKFLLNDVEIDANPRKPVDLEKPEYDYIPTDEELKKPHKKLPKTKNAQSNHNSLDINSNNRAMVNSQESHYYNKGSEELSLKKQNYLQIENSSEKEHYHLQYPNHTFVKKDCPVCLRKL